MYRHSADLYKVLQPFLATTEVYLRKNKATTGRKIEFMPEENRPRKCFLPVKWIPPHKKLPQGWVRLTYLQFCKAYNLLPID